VRNSAHSSTCAAFSDKPFLLCLAKSYGRRDPGETGASVTA
jgi:hypothetical protein